MDDTSIMGDQPDWLVITSPRWRANTTVEWLDDRRAMQRDRYHGRMRTWVQLSLLF